MRFKRVFAAEIRTLAFLTGSEKIKRIKFLVYENGMPIHDLDAAADITRIFLIEDGKEIGEKTAQKTIITELVNNGMSIEELSQKLNMSIADINNILNQNATC